MSSSQNLKRQIPSRCPLFHFPSISKQEGGRHLGAIYSFYKFTGKNEMICWVKTLNMWPASAVKDDKQHKCPISHQAHPTNPTHLFPLVG